MMRRKSIKPPLIINFYASPTTFWAVLLLCGLLQLIYLCLVKSILWATVVSVVGTLPFTLGEMFSPPDFFRPGLRNFANFFYGKSENRSSERESYHRFVRSKYYRMLVLKFGLRLAIVPYVAYLAGFIEFPDSWVIFHRKFHLLEHISTAIGFQWLLTFCCLGVMIAIYLKKNWAQVVAAGEEEPDPSLSGVPPEKEGQAQHR